MNNISKKNKSGCKDFAKFALCYFILPPFIFLAIVIFFSDFQNYSELNYVNTKTESDRSDLDKEEKRNKSENNSDSISCMKDIWECDNWGICSNNGTQKRVCTKTFDCPTVETLPPNVSKSCKFEINNSDPLKRYLEIVKKVKSAPDSIITSSYDSGTAKVTFIWEWVASENLFAVEVKTNTYIDEFGDYRTSEVVDIFQFRDQDLDGRPDDYWCGSWGYDLRFKKLDKSVQEFENLNLIWTMGIDYFLENILMK